MHSTKIVISFIKNNNRLLILKRSEKVITIKALCSGVNEIIHGKNPVNRVKIKFFEKVVMIEDKLNASNP